jgi:hypothetical protein
MTVNWRYVRTGVGAIQMTEADKQALAIYETLEATSKDRPLGFRSVEEARRATAEFQQNNPGLIELRRAEPVVLHAFLSQCVDWLRAEANLAQNYGVCTTLQEAIKIAFERAPRPLLADLVSKLFRDYVDSMGGMASLYFPIRLLVAAISRDQVTDEMRPVLQKFYLRLAPSPTGKIEPRDLEFRNQIGELIRVEGEIQLEPGRGPWSQIVFDEIKKKEEITRAGWEGLLEHCRSLEQAAPGAKWKKRAHELIGILGEQQVFPVMLGWLALGPTPGQPSEARSPIEDSSYQKGVVWCLAERNDRETAVAVADFGIACLRKIQLLGAVSQKVGFSCVQVLGAMDCSEAVAQLTRLRAKVKYTVARRLIEKSLRQAAERSGLTVQALEDISVDRYGLDAEGKAEIEIGDAKAVVRLAEDGKVGVAWFNADGKPAKSALSHVKKAFAKEVRGVASLAKELEQAYFAQRARLEASFLLPGDMPLAHWRQYFIDHPLLGFLGRRLIWVFRNEQGSDLSGIWSGQGVIDSAGNAVDFAAARTVRLWHPLASNEDEVQRWRARIFAAKIRQPFRQAFREFYAVTDGERETRMYSNRFAKVLMRQHQFASLCRARGWEYRLMGTNFDGANTPTRKLDAWSLRAEFYVDMPPDRDPSLHESGLGEQSGAGINLFIGSDQVRFYRDRREVAIDEVPAIVYSEVMRDVDLFTSVCAVGADESWSDQGDRGIGIFSEDFNASELMGIIALRRETLSLVLPHTPIHDRCKIHKTWLEVRGQLGTYRIEFAWGGASMVSGSTFRLLNIPRKVLDGAPLDFAAIPTEMDYRSEMILRKAYILADDWKIDSPDLIKQLMPR